MKQSRSVMTRLNLPRVFIGFRCGSSFVVGAFAVGLLAVCFSPQKDEVDPILFHLPSLLLTKNNNHGCKLNQIGVVDRMGRLCAARENGGSDFFVQGFAENGERRSVERVIVPYDSTIGFGARWKSGKGVLPAPPAFFV